MEKLLALVPDEVLSELAIETKVDYNAKKLQGEVIFKLLLYCLLTTKECSLRSAASAYESAIFGMLNAKYGKGSIRHSSISERLSTINADYFEKLYRHCVTAYKDTIGKTDTDKLLRFDSTIVALSGKLLDVGYRLKGGDADHLRQLKFTVGLGSIPEAVDFYHSQQHNAENAALRDSILKSKEERGDLLQIRVFDRGITSRATYDALSDSGIRFVSRIAPGAKHQVLHPNRLEEGPLDTQRLIIEQDIDAQLFGEGGTKARHSYRIIKARVKSGAATAPGVRDEELWFITNIGAKELSAVQVAQLYRRRWDIEVFFKFIKQHLNFSHLLNRTENGITVVMYVTMIAAILVLAYRKLASLSGYKMAKQRLAQELETELLKIIIAGCGGNPEMLHKILYPNSS